MIMCSRLVLQHQFATFTLATHVTMTKSRKPTMTRICEATKAVVDLYNRGVMVSKIQKAFSVGAFGVEKKRRLVPTRWSITAVDDIISKNLREKVKTFPEINEYRVYESIYMDNVFEILMIPAQWSYESMEAWYPGTVWNPAGSNIAIF